MGTSALLLGQAALLPATGNARLDGELFFKLWCAIGADLELIDARILQAFAMNETPPHSAVGSVVLGDVALSGGPSISFWQIYFSTATKEGWYTGTKEQYITFASNWLVNIWGARCAAKRYKEGLARNGNDPVSAAGDYNGGPNWRNNDGKYYAWRFWDHANKIGLDFALPDGAVEPDDA